MEYGKMATRTKILAGAVLLCLGSVVATAASATDTFGGGATLPAGAYVGFNFVGATNAVLSSNTSTQFAGQNPSAVDSTSLFGVWAAATSNKISYCQTGSGNGKKIFDKTDGTTALTSVGACAGGLTGFGAPAGVAVDPYFAGSDAPMSSSEYTLFGTATTGKGPVYGQPSQFPAVAGSIAIVYHNADAPQGTLNLSDAQICGVLNHTITTWDQLGVSTTANPHKPIKVVYRSDGSGTSFSLSNHLTAVCGPSGGHHFLADQAFTTVVSQFGTPAGFGWTGANGNGGVITEMNLPAEDGAISYAESANLKAAAAAGSAANIAYATVNSKDPYADFPNSVSVTAVQNFVVSGVNATTGAPAISLVTPLVASSKCLNIVNPTTYANVTSRYPIMAVSYLIVNYKGNGSDVSAVRSLISSAYDATHTGVKTIGNDPAVLPALPVNGVKTGFAFVSPTTAIDPTACVNM
ncbi:MAG TPA: substrate-binding domain-containing protein [Luteibacter sp.]|jgi:ABC-type phosphate transport system substrate-binding protein|nr:substrate-binding domain-containing protein [Luteibacter sp.]